MYITDTFPISHHWTKEDIRRKRSPKIGPSICPNPATMTLEECEAEIDVSVWCDHYDGAYVYRWDDSNKGKLHIPAIFFHFIRPESRWHGPQQITSARLCVGLKRQVEEMERIE